MFLVLNLCSTHPSGSALTSLAPDRTQPFSVPSETPPNSFPSYPVGQFSSSQHTRVISFSPPIQKQPRHRETAHPYSNPELLGCYASESNDSLHQVVAPSTRNSGANAAVVNISDNKSTASAVLPDEAKPQRQHPIRKMETLPPTAALHGNEVNTTYLNHNTSSLSLNLPPPSFTGSGWSSLSNSSTVTLISLQEAQVRERSRSATVHSALTQSKKVDPELRVPLPSQDGIVNMSENIEDSAPRANMSVSRSRAQSVSAGAHGKATVCSNVGPGSHPPERKDSDLSASSTCSDAGRPLRNKRSVFLRLFSNQGDGDKTLPPSMPSLPGAYLVQDNQPEVAAKSYGPSRNRDSVTPSPSPSLTVTTSNLTLSSQNAVLADHDDRDFGFDLQVPGHRKHHPRIVTGVPVPNSSEPNLCACTAPSSPLSPYSAPLTATDYQKLRLRPVSKVFSAHFPDFVANPGQGTLNPDAAMHSAAMVTISGSLSPCETSGHACGVPEDRSLTIQALQDQIFSARKAWELQIGELQEKVRDLQTEVESLRIAGSAKHCNTCRQDIRERRGGNDGLQMKTSGRVKVRAGDQHIL